MFLVVFSKASIFIIVVDHVRDLNFGTFELPHSSFYRHEKCHHKFCNLFVDWGLYDPNPLFSWLKNMIPFIPVAFCYFFYIIYLYTHTKPLIQLF